MKFKDLFQDVEEWFWKLEYNPELNGYELYLGIPNDWVFAEKSDGLSIELIHELEENSIIKISYGENEELTVDDVIDTAKSLILKNRELEKRKEEHRIEMENLKNLLIEKEKSFLEYVDKVKDDGVNVGITEKAKENINELVSEAVIKAEVTKKMMDTPDMKVVDMNDDKGKDFVDDIEKLKLK